MKKHIIFIFLFLSVSIYSQETNLEKKVKVQAIYDKIKKEFDSLKLHSAQADFDEERRVDFRKAYSKLLELDDFTSLAVQNALLKDYKDKYNLKPLEKRFENKEEVIKRIDELQLRFTASLALLYSKDVSKHYDELNKAYDNYLQRNLKRLNLSKDEFDKLTEKDKDLLWKEFK